MPRTRTPRSVQSSGARAAFFATGTVTALLAAGFLAVAGVVLWASTKTDDHGYTTSATHSFASSKAALASENLDIDLDGAGWLLDSGDDGDVRVNVTSATDEPVFVGVAKTSDAKRYLAGVGHTTVTDFDDVPFAASYDQHPGARTAPLPGEQDIWVASEIGAGTQSLDWDVADGAWSVVVMNADGSPGVRADVDAGVKIPYLSAVGFGSGGAGALLALLAGTLFVLGARPIRQRPLDGLRVPAQA